MSAGDKFAGGLAVITGAGSGIGAALARRAATLGMRVVLADIDEAGAEAVAQSLRENGGTAQALRLDVSQASELDRLAAHVSEHHGPVRLLVNNAGIETLGYVWEITPERWEQTLRVNLHGVIHSVRAFVPTMLASGEECWIANVASIAALGQMPTQTPYMATKHAVQAFSECLYLEMQSKGAPIHVSSVLPAWVKSAIFDEDAAAGETAFGTRQREVMRAGMAAQGMEPDDAAALILDGIAAGDFWVSTHPEITQAMACARAAFLEALDAPQLSPEAKAILDS